eukprot:TRINITY_DN31557_c0_g1_i1.p1 TRINITY_DN31557_c0_g1~~TRINITY_DN31557_c0_g1_i1.p1  ORF type:complete len:127 (+),score=26.41 TRINITY_DN31557_c0_g1_i1:106-486(+)
MCIRDRVCNLDKAGCGEEDVGGFEIAVKHAVAVHVIHRHQHLDEEQHHLRLREIVSSCVSDLDVVPEVARISKFHHNHEFSFANLRIDIFNNIGVVGVFEAMDLRLSVSQLLGPCLLYTSPSPRDS